VKRLAADVRELVAEQVEYRELLAQMIRRDLLLRYKQTVMGIGWAIFMPLVNTVIFSIVFMRAAKIETGMPYPLYAFCGLLVWNFLAMSAKFAVTSLASNASLVTKIYFPREIFPLSAVLVSLVDFGVASVGLVALMIWYGVGLHWTLVLLPLVIGVQLAFTVALALFLAMANLFYRDVKYLFEIFLTVWMFATSVVYPVEQVGGRLAEVLMFNPMTPIVEAYRDVLIRGVVPGPAFGYAAVASFVLLGVAWVQFHRAEFQFAENV
jgi:ABC-type polysaccharide/polyol phosphate export permease